jgi:hypothetical protein
VKALKLTPQMVTILRGIAHRPTQLDSKLPNADLVSAAGACPETAYAIGVSDGEAQLARRILQAAGA